MCAQQAVQPWVSVSYTHLSIGHFIIDQNPDTKVLYVTSEEFTNEVIESIRNGNSSAMTKFRDKYRTVICAFLFIACEKDNDDYEPIKPPVEQPERCV